MYRVELIAKQSVMADIRQSWINSGREDNAEHGVFVFDSVDYVGIGDAQLLVNSGKNRFIYNIADFYRIKITDIDGNQAPF